MSNPDQPAAVTPPPATTEQPPPAEPPLPPMRPIAPEVQALLARGRLIQESLSSIRAVIVDSVKELVEAYPGYKKQIAEVLEGECQRLLREVHQENQEARRGSR
jgi:hypothetical protein